MRQDSSPLIIIEPDLDRLHAASMAIIDGDQKQALADLKQLSDEGSTMAMLYLGDAYKLGRGVKSDLKQAENWYRQACDQGSPLGCDRLARFLIKRGKLAEG